MKKGKDILKEKQETSVMESLTPISKLFISPGVYCNVVLTLGFQTKSNPSAIVEGIKNTWIKLPRFSSKLEMKENGKSVWIPVNVRVEDHLIIPDLDTSNIENPDQFLEDYTSNIVNAPMDKSRPLWEFHILNIKTSNAESIGIGRIHHSLGDGASLMSLLLASSRKISDQQVQALPTTMVTKKHVDSNDKTGLVGRFLFMIRIFFTTFIELFKIFLTLCFMRDTNTPVMSKPGDKFRFRKIIHRIISFDDVKMVKNTMGMKVNDVLLGITQAGLSRYLSKKFDEDMVVKKKTILEKIRLRSTMFINLRTEKKIQELSKMMEKGSKCRWGNFIGIAIAPFWIKSEDDPLEYVRKAKSTMDIKKISKESIILYGINKFVIKIFGVKVAETILKRILSQTTLIFSNVMGPNEELSFFGHPMTYITTSVSAGPQALILHFVSYANKISISLAVDTTVIPDPHELCDDLVKSLEIIKLAILEKGLSKMEV